MNTRHRPKKSIDPTYYMGYFPDDEPLERIEERFRILDEKEKNNVQGKSEFELAKSTFIETALPQHLPLNLWYQLDSVEEDEDDYFYADDPNGELYDDVVRSSRSMHKYKSKTGSEAPGSLASFSTIDQLGSGFELWPDYKLKPIFKRVEGHFIHDEFPNEQCGVSYEEFLDYLKSNTIFYVDRINCKTIGECIAKATNGYGTIPDVDCILMDPPFNSANFDHSRFAHLLADFKSRMTQTFIFIWIDPSNFSEVCLVASDLDFKFCDSVCCELLTPMGERYYVSSSMEEGMKFCTRMLLIYRNFDVQRNDLAQQRVKDTGWGICMPSTKNYGRSTMPQTPHFIIETMLPQRKNGMKRIFIELWPSEFARREGWIMIDEK